MMVNGLDKFVMLPNLRVITRHHVPRGPSNNEVGTHRPKLLFPRLSLFFAKTQIFRLMAVIIQKRKSLGHSSLGTKMRLQCLQRATVAISQPFSTSSRIVTCFHEAEVDDEKKTFSDREPMHQRIYNLISTYGLFAHQTLQSAFRTSLCTSSKMITVKRLSESLTRMPFESISQVYCLFLSSKMLLSYKLV